MEGKGTARDDSVADKKGAVVGAGVGAGIGTVTTGPAMAGIGSMIGDSNADIVGTLGYGVGVLLTSIIGGVIGFFVDNKKE